MMKLLFASLVMVTALACTTLQEKVQAKAPPRLPTHKQTVVIAEPEPVMPEPPKKTISSAVGVLLPLSGPFKIYGDRTLAAMRLALDFDSSEMRSDALLLKSKNGISLVVMDTRGQAELAAQGVDLLVDNYHVGAIVGDLLSDTASAIAKRAEERGVINISLSGKEDVTAIGPSVFRLAMTAKKQVSALLTQRADQKELKRFAVLYPANVFGTKMRDAFVSEVKKRGGTVAKVEGYPPDETTFTSYIRRLVGAKRTAGNSAYEECVEKANRLKDASARRKNTNDCLDAVVPSVGFDAIFIPEFPKTLSYIIPALISEGVMVSQNESMLKSYRRTSHISDAEAVQLLGPSSWNNPSLGEKLGAQIEGAIFVDGGDLDSTKPQTNQFVEDFKHVFDSGPSFAEALAYDVTKMLQTIYGSQHALNPGLIASDLLKLQYLGVSGKISFDTDRESVIPFRWFAFHEGQILPQS